MQFITFLKLSATTFEGHQGLLDDKSHCWQRYPWLQKKWYWQPTWNWAPCLTSPQTTTEPSSFKAPKAALVAVSFRTAVLSWSCTAPGFPPLKGSPQQTTDPSFVEGSKRASGSSHIYDVTKTISNRTTVTTWSCITPSDDLSWAFDNCKCIIGGGNLLHFVL